MNNLLNIKSFLKFLSRNKGYTAIDVFGLSVSLMFVILIAVYVERELNIDKQQANYDRIVAIGNEEFLESGVPVSLAGRAVSGDRESLSGHHGSREE